MGHHIGSNCIRSLPAKGRIAGYRIGEHQSAGDANIEQQPPRRVDFAERKVMEYRAGRPAISPAWRPKNFTTLAHFSTSSARNLPKSAGDPASSDAPKSASRAFDLESARTALISLLSLSTMSAGVFLGAPTPAQALVS